MSFRIYDATLDALTLKQCTAGQFSPNNRITAGRASGGVLPSALFLESGEPRMRWSSTDVGAALAAISATGGLNCTSNLILPLRVLQDGGTYAGSGQHVSIAGTSGLVVIQQVSCQGKGDASVDLEAAFRSSDGHTNPVAFNSGLTLSSPSFNDAYRLAPASLNGSPVTGLTGFSVNFGINLINDLDEDGFTWPKRWYIDSQDPTIDCTFRNQALANTYGPSFLTMTGAVFKLRRRAQGGTVVSGASMAHISFTFTGGIMDVQQVGAQGNAQGEVTLRLYGTGLAVATNATVT